TVEQLQFNRKKELDDERKAEAERIERELENTTLSKFVKNVESRIYATLSKQMVDAMFADCSTSCATTGTAEIEGSTITWTKDTTTGEISLEVVEQDGTVTRITIPGSGEFNF
ncbi:MAG: curli assembly protein CsgF, partial [Pelagibacteraceae bacterium]